MLQGHVVFVIVLFLYIYIYYVLIIRSWSLLPPYSSLMPTQKHESGKHQRFYILCLLKGLNMRPFIPIDIRAYESHLFILFWRECWNSFLFSRLFPCQNPRIIMERLQECFPYFPKSFPFLFHCILYLFSLVPIVLFIRK